VSLPGNLPVQVTGFVGRDQDLGECAEALATSRVVTVTGVGGVGKTRLALQVAADAFRCPYVAIQVAVKIRYHFWVTLAEHDAIARVLSVCPTQPLPTSWWS
jgi:hypothetical protein